MSFTDEDKVRIRHHMGYLNVSEVQTYSLGVPAAVETQYLIEGAMNRVLPEAEVHVFEVLSRLDAIECQMTGDLELLAVDEIGEIKVNRKEMNQLRREYRHWQWKLANALGVEPNKYDYRFRSSLNLQVCN
jgi:hypothetical protein